MKKSTILVLCFLVLFMTNLTGSALSPLDYPIIKLTTITLIEPGYFRLQTTYLIDNNIDVLLVSSDGIRASNIANISVKINDIAIPPENYSELVPNGKEVSNPLRIVSLNAPLSDFRSLYQGKINVDFLFDFYRPISSDLDMLVVENSLVTQPQVQVSYWLQIISNNDKYVPYIINSDVNVRTEQAKINETVLNYVYTSYALKDKNYSVKPYYGIQFLDTSKYPILQSTRTIKFIDSKTVIETYEYQLSGKDFSDKISHLNIFAIPRQANPTDHPRISFLLDNQPKTLTKITYEELSKIIQNGSELTTSPIYYFGKGNNLSNNTLYFGYNLPINSTAELKYSFEYNSKNLISTSDGFNFRLKYPLIFPIYLKEIDQYWKFEVPSDFIIKDTNFKEQLLSQDTHLAVWKFNDIDEFFTGNFFIINFQEMQTQIYDRIRIVNILLSVFLIATPIFLYRKLVNKPKQFKRLLLIPSISFLIEIIYYVLFQTYQLFNVIIYTWLFLPIFGITFSLSLIYKEEICKQLGKIRIIRKIIGSKGKKKHMRNI